MPPEIAVVVPTYRRPDQLGRLLEALTHQTLAVDRWELVVVDNASQDPAVDALLAGLDDRIPCATLTMVMPVNRGPAPARNRGWQATSAPIVAFVDDDVVPDPDWLEAGLAALADDGIGVMMGRTAPPPGTDLAAIGPYTMRHDITAVSPHFEACNIFYRREALERTGGYDERFGWWGEDTALGWEVLEHGWRSAFAEHARVTHDLEERGPRWFARHGWLEHKEIVLAARYPGFRRDAFWRPWGVRKRDVAFTMAVVSLAVGLRWRPAWLGVVPYFVWGHPAFLPIGGLARRWADALMIDAARSAGHLYGSARGRVVVF